MKGPFSWCIAAVVLSMLSPSSAVAVTNDVMAQSPSKMDDMKNTYNSEVQDFFDETVEQAMEQDDTNFKEENEAVIETDELEEAQVEGLDTNFEENEAVIETDDHEEAQVEGLESEEVIETNEEAVEEKNEEAQEQGILGPFYRYWNSRIDDHFYTMNRQEIGTTTPGRRGRHGFVSEGIAIYLLKRPRRYYSVPLYRYWQPYLRDHFYTTNSREIGTTVPGHYGRWKYRSEGIAGYCYPKRYRIHSRYWKLVPLYRYWKARGSDHFYTTNSAEIGTTIPGHVGRYGYKSEGITCYGFVRK